jgi:hypothetical protein
MGVKYFNNFHSKALQNIPEEGFYIWKYTIWQPRTWSADRKVYEACELFWIRTWDLVPSKSDRTRFEIGIVEPKTDRRQLPLAYRPLKSQVFNESTSTLGKINRLDPILRPWATKKLQHCEQPSAFCKKQKQISSTLKNALACGNASVVVVCTCSSRRIGSRVCNINIIIVPTKD